MTSSASRLPQPHRPEREAATACLRRVEGALEWSRVVAMASPWLESARAHPAPFWALETLLREYPISSAEGTALMRLAEALLRVPDRETAIALTADQLGRAAFASHHPQDWLGALSARALVLSKAMLPEGESGESGLLRRLGAEAVVALAVRAVQLLGRQFVLGETIENAMARAAEWRSHYPPLRFSYDMLGEGARTAAVARRYLEHYLQAVDALAPRADEARHPDRKSVV